MLMGSYLIKHAKYFTSGLLEENVTVMGIGQRVLQGKIDGGYILLNMLTDWCVHYGKFTNFPES